MLSSTELNFQVLRPSVQITKQMSSIPFDYKQHESQQLKSIENNSKSDCESQMRYSSFVTRFANQDHDVEMS